MHGKTPKSEWEDRKEPNSERSQLTAFEEEKITETFKLFDKDNNGYIDEEELSNILESNFLRMKPHRSARTEADQRRLADDAGRGGRGDRPKNMYVPQPHAVALETFLRIMTEQKTNYALEDDYDISMRGVCYGG